MVKASEPVNLSVFSTCKEEGGRGICGLFSITSERLSEVFDALTESHLWHFVLSNGLRGESRFFFCPVWTNVGILMARRTSF